MLGADVFVIEPLCLLIGKLHDLSGTSVKVSYIAFTFIPRFDTPCKPPPTRKQTNDLL